YTAAREGINSTGNASRASFRSLPAVGSSNLVLLPGEKSTAALMDGINKGLYITEVMGMHTVNPISGDYSVGASGIMIEKGCLTFPVRGITIAGNIMDLLQSIDGVGSDMRFYGSRASASIRLKSINISG
ncbi:MAG: TldD/PmbA family protein, partial [Syntrophomonadaceae bacterium]|nr:TldD/PmbA family protein [Syntrophomonadaceae bacterium]